MSRDYLRRREAWGGEDCVWGWRPDRGGIGGEREGGGMAVPAEGKGTGGSIRPPSLLAPGIVGDGETC